MEDGARVDVDEYEKDSAGLALWKAAKPGEMSWDTPIGRGGRVGTLSARRCR